jgi:hypothetical protein
MQTWEEGGGGGEARLDGPNCDPIYPLFVIQQQQQSTLLFPSKLG